MGEGMSTHVRLLLALFLGVIFTGRATRHVERSEYALVELAGIPGAEGASGYALNSRGQVAGSGYTLQDKSIGKPLLWVGGELTELSALPGNDAGNAYGINDAGEACGFSRFKYPIGEGQRACYWSADGTVHDVGTLGGKVGISWDINNRRQVVGSAASWEASAVLEKDLRTELGMRAFLWENGRIRDLGILPGHSWSEAKAISENGHIVRKSSDGEKASRAVLWRDGKIMDLGVPKDYPNSSAYDVNSAGQVVGGMRGTVGRAFLRDETGVKDLGAPVGFEQNAAMAINERGQVVGVATSGDRRCGWLWSGGKFTDLNDLVPEGSGWRVLEAWDINDRGDILARATQGDRFRSVVLRRVP